MQKAIIVSMEGTKLSLTIGDPELRTIEDVVVAWGRNIMIYINWQSAIIVEMSISPSRPHRLMCKECHYCPYVTLVTAVSNSICH